MSSASSVANASKSSYKRKGARLTRAPVIFRSYDYFRCLLTSLVISNMLTVALPPKTGFSAASALIMRLFFASCRPFFLM